MPFYKFLLYLQCILLILEHCVGLHWILRKIVSINFVPDTQPRDITIQLLTFEKLEVPHPVKGLK